jgi:hypothetical protein
MRLSEAEYRQRRRNVAAAHLRNSRTSCDRASQENRQKYKGVTNALLLLSESLKEFRKNGPAFPPRRSLAPEPL